MYMTKRKENSLIKKKKNWGVAAVILLAGILLLFAVLFFLQEKNNQENNSQSSAIKAMVYMENNGVGGNGSIFQITEEEVLFYLSLIARNTIARSLQTYPT